MSKKNSQRKSCKDTFNAFLVENATYAGLFEFPHIKATSMVPNRLISFSSCIHCSDYDQWVHFYEDDYLFERIWRNPSKFIDILKKYNGVILPDFSLYRDMPFAMQIYNIYRSRAIGSWLQANGIEVIPNIRYGDKRTYRLCCDGIEKHSIIAVGSHGTMKIIEDRRIFLEGLDVVVKRIEPSYIIIYGTASDKYFKKYKDLGINIIQFDSVYATSHKGVV